MRQLVLAELEKNGRQSRESDLVSKIIPHVRPERAARRFAFDHRKKHFESYDMLQVIIPTGARSLVLIELQNLARQGVITRKGTGNDKVVRLVCAEGNGKKKRPRISKVSC